MTVKSRYQKLNQQVYQSSQEAIRSAQQAHDAVNQAQSSLLPQEIQYAEHKVCEALSYLRQVQNQLQNQSIAPEIQESLQQEESRLIQEYELF
ncbi:MAG: hypothetical protein GX119_08120 [Syntrophomonadaceae bacterium]|jgi:histone deacetylase complex regulatory component SIN3|nr:hypothetical protein [Syntrophomonadaceae bacterium]